MVRDILPGGLQKVFLEARPVLYVNFRHHESGRLGLGVQQLNSATSDE
jgi:hypothetical protein